MPLSVSAEIPHGNVCDVRVLDGADGPVIEFTAHPHGGPECLWFCFRIENAAPAASLPAAALVLRNPHNLLGGNHPQHMRPVVRYPGSAWERLGPARVEELPDGRSSAIWTFRTPSTHADVAFCYPYGAPELEALLADTHPAWHVHTIGVSQAGRPLVRLSNAHGEPGAQTPGVYLVARQHSGETPGSWVLDGFLRQAAAAETKALVWAIPFANVDGVEQGDYGKDNFPYDLNRAWGRPPMRHENLVLQQDMRRWQARCRPVLVLDLHAPGAGETDGAYVYAPREVAKDDVRAAGLRLAQAIGESLTPTYAAANFVRTADYPSRWETPNLTHFAGNELGVSALTLETPYALCGPRVLTTQDYREIGRRIALAVLPPTGTAEGTGTLA